MSLKYEPSSETASHFCEAVVLKLGTVLNREGIEEEEEGTAIMGQMAQIHKSIIELC